MDRAMQRLAERLRLDPRPLLDEFEHETGSREGDRFAAWLHQRGVIDRTSFLELLECQDLEVSALPTVVQAAETVALGSSAEAPPGQGSPPSATSTPTSTSSGQVRTDGTPSASTARYGFLGLLGAGAMGEVHVVRDTALRRRVAYKRMLPDVAQRPALAARFLEEAQVTAQLDHPNIVPIYDVELGSADGIPPAYAMKLVAGRTLGDLLLEQKARPAQERRAAEPRRRRDMLEALLHACDALAYAHGRGVIHRDLKPENLMIGAYHEVYVMDWGICRVVGSTAPDADPVELPGDPSLPSQRTQYGTVLGTPRYMSPEQAEGRNAELDGRSDLYTLGLILQEIVTLKPARRAAATLVDAVVLASQGTLEPIVHEDPRLSIDGDLVAIIHKATARDRDARYPSVEAFADDLRRYLSGHETMARPDRGIRRLLRFVGRHRGATVIAMLLLGLGGVGIEVQHLSSSRAAMARARQHEAQLAGFLSQVAHMADAIDDQIHRQEAQLERLSGRILEALLRAEATTAATQPAQAEASAPRAQATKAQPPRAASPTSPAKPQSPATVLPAANVLAPPAEPPRPTYYLARDLDDAARRPADAFASAYYGRIISLEHPSFQLAPDLDPPQAATELRALGRLGSAFRARLIASTGETPELFSDEAARVLIGDHGVPILRAFVTLVDGLHGVYPGIGGFPGDYDARTRPEYLLADRQHALRWGNPYRDRYGHGILLPSSNPLYDDRRRFLGVVGFCMTFEWLIENLMKVELQPYTLDRYLVTEQGQVVLHLAARPVPGAPFGDARDAQEATGAIPLLPLPLPSVVEALRPGARGHVLLPDGRVAAWEPLQSLGWFYVAVADGPALFGASAHPRDLAAR